MPVEVAMSLKTVSHYDLLEKIAEGGMGAVYKGRDQITGQVVAVKVVPKHLLSNQIFIKRFEQEYNAARNLDHPNVVRALDFGADGDTPFLVMEFVEGESLGAKLEREEVLSEEESIRIISQVAQGLHKAHKMGLIHRDVKPDNILLTKDGTAKLTDLGLVKELEADQNLTRTGRGLGTPHFMAPEQFRNAKKADARCDIYSLAATLYMMVTGELPFKSMNPLDAWMKKINNELPPPRKVNGAISERIDWAIRRSMSADPTLRAPSCREFVEDLLGQTSRTISSEGASQASSDWWYMVYKDDEGTVHTVKGTKLGIRRSLKEQLLGDASQIRIAPSKQGPFQPLRQHPEFRDLIEEIDRPSGTIPDSLDKTLPRVPAASKSASKLPPSKVSPSSGTLKPASNASDSEMMSTSTTGPVFLNIAEDEFTDESGEWVKYTLFMLAGIVLGVIGFLLLSKFNFRLF